MDSFAKLITLIKQRLSRYPEYQAYKNVAESTIENILKAYTLVSLDDNWIFTDAAKMYAADAGELAKIVQRAELESTQYNKDLVVVVIHNCKKIADIDGEYRQYAEPANYRQQGGEAAPPESAVSPGAPEQSGSDNTMLYLAIAAAGVLAFIVFGGKKKR